MQNDYGIYKENEEGIIEWVVTAEPLLLGSEEDAINNLSEDDAELLAGELGEGFAVGRPGDRVPKA